MTVLVACATPHAGPRRPATPVGAARDWLAEATALCTADHGETSGRSLCGPMMLVDPKTRLVVANQADAQGRLQPQAGVFVGTPPGDVNATNTAIDWAGVHWTQLIRPLPPDRDQRAVLLVHESFTGSTSG